jgi:hypothetical protein
MRQVMVALTVLALTLPWGAQAEEREPKLELDLTLSELNGASVGLGIATSLLVSTVGGAQAAAKMSSLMKRLDSLTKGPVPKTTEEANKLLGSGRNPPGVRTGYQARLRATLRREGARFVVESGTVNYSLYAHSVLAQGDTAIVDKVSARGTYQLKPEEVEVRFAPPEEEGAPPTWSMTINVHHPFSPQGYSDWSVKGGQVMAMHIQYEGDKEIITGQTAGQAWPQEVSVNPKSRSFRYDATGQEVTRHTPRRSATWVDMLGTHHAVSYTLRYQSDVLAEFTASPMSPVLGQKLELDASASKGQGLEYEWTFEVPDNGCFTGDTGNPEAKKTGKKTSVVLLCDTTVKLKVTDFKHESDETERTLHLRPRRGAGWGAIPFKTQEEYAVLGALAVGRGCEDCQPSKPYGVNRCAHYEQEQHDHQIHREPPSKPGITRRQVKDAGGPFDGWWYAESHSFTAPRVRQINTELAPVTAKIPKADRCKRFVPGATVYGVNVACNELNGGVVYDVELARQATSHHELIHSNLFQEALNRLKAERVVEKMIGADESQLLARVECSMGVADRIIHAWGNSELEVAYRMMDQPAFRKTVALLLRKGEGDDGVTPHTYSRIGDKEGLVNAGSASERQRVKETFEEGVRNFEQEARGCAGN